MSSPTPGWYPDPQGHPIEHYWSGTAWTGHTRPTGPPQQQPTAPLDAPGITAPPSGGWTSGDYQTAPLPTVPPRPNRPVHKRPLVIVAASIVALLIIFIALGAALGSSGSSTNAGNTHSLAASSTPPPAASTSSTAPTTSSPATKTSSSHRATPPPPATPSGFTMPNEVGKGLQAAQDDLQRVSGNPLYISLSADATGRGRHQIFDRDWQVCAQNVPPGTTVTDAMTVTFSAVKLWESCP